MEEDEETPTNEGKLSDEDNSMVNDRTENKIEPTREEGNEGQEEVEPNGDHLEPANGEGNVLDEEVYPEDENSIEYFESFEFDDGNTVDNKVESESEDNENKTKAFYEEGNGVGEEVSETSSIEGHLVDDNEYKHEGSENTAEPARELESINQSKQSNEVVDEEDGFNIEGQEDVNVANETINEETNIVDQMLGFESEGNSDNLEPTSEKGNVLDEEVYPDEEYGFNIEGQEDVNVANET